MTKPTIVTDNIFRLSLNVEDLLFEQLWEIPNGVTINSYLIKGDKTALIDGVCGWDGVPEQLYALLDQLDIAIGDVDYIIINHMEPDHSGWIERFKVLKPDVQIYCSHLAARLLKAFFGIVEGVNIIKSGDQLDLGQGKVLTFYQQPNVHWPDTMFTMELSSETLFTCDMFGSFGVCNDNHYDDQFSSDDFDYFFDEQIRYFSNVLITFYPAVKNAIDKAQALNPKVIAPAHGPVYRTQPQTIIDNYRQLIAYATGHARPEVTLIWGSMYGMTQKAVDAIIRLLEAHDIVCHVLRVPQTSVGDIMAYSLRAQAIIVAAPTYENGMFPPAISAMDELGRKKVHHKNALYVGSYGWSGGAAKDLSDTLAHYNMNWQLNDSITFIGEPDQNALESIETAVLKLIDRLKEV